MPPSSRACCSRALAPIDPPAELEARLEETLGSLVDLAADELEAWELRAMRDPRNWLRPAAAAVVGSGAAVGLVLVRTRRRRHRRRAACQQRARPRGAHAARRLPGSASRPGGRDARALTLSSGAGT